MEFDDSALEFLLSEGFTPDLGARPLKRAVERHFLTLLAYTGAQGTTRALWGRLAAALSWG